MLRQIMQRTITGRFFNKLFLTYSLIIVTTVVILISFITDNIATTLKRQAISFNQQVLVSLDSYYQQKITNMKVFLRNIINDEEFYSSIAQFLEISSDDDQAKYMSLFTAVQSKLTTSIVSLDNDITNVYLYRNDQSPALVPIYKRIQNYPYNIDESYMKDLVQTTMFFPPIHSSMTKYPQSTYEYTTYDFIRDPDDVSRILGVLVIDYDCRKLVNSFSRFREYIKGNILILTESGEVVFDDSERYYKKNYPHTDVILGSQSNTIYLKNEILNINRNSRYGFISVGEIPFRDLYQDIGVINRKIYTITAISLLMILLLTFISNARFSKRVRDIVRSIRKIRNGIFEIPPPPSNTKDEIGIISMNVFEMSQRIKSHIEKEYVYDLRRKETELKQKEAELYALQSQVNPHFLYNTLEVIRMKALTYKQNEVSTMIRILSDLFRSSIKEQMVVRLRDELNYCKIYLELFTIRYGDRLEAIFDISEAVLPLGTIKHLLQPVVENSLIHGIQLDWDSDRVNRIGIRGYLEDEFLILEVADNGPGIPEDKLQEMRKDLDDPYLTKQQIGLFNVNRRIKLIYGNDYSLQIASKPGNGTTVKLKLKPLTLEELEAHVQSDARG
ncbi:sensor histidine kinase [Cohnella zeiphila]|uniref:Histidine kinase n=1 Tax=Cohnella zeiphila TaxID=2761120 RepID=A0A7X0SQ53_9BACL|nr:histidine kinase [Cohnella zeiphila]MBB6734029.1 histidine kinase [Cohnella zeiphila]